MAIELLDALEEYLTADTNLRFQQSEDESFSIKDMNSAAWAVRKIEKAQRRITEVEKVAAVQIAKVQAWVAETTQAERHTIDAMQNLLRPWAEAELKGNKKKSLKVLSTTCGFRKGSLQYTKDDTILFDWAKANGLTRVKEETDWARIKKESKELNGRLVSTEGEIIPGVTVETPPDTFYVKLGEGGKDE